MRASTRAKINYLVDAAIAVAFVLLAASGLVFLLPSGWVSVSSGSAPAVLGVSLAAWRSVHDWSALVMFSGVVLHTALHWRWVVAMTKKTFAPARGARSGAGRRAPVDRQPAPVFGSPLSTDSPAAVQHAAEATPPRPATAAEGGGEAAAPRRTRREVLVGAGMVAAAVVTGGLAGRALSDQWLARSETAGAADLEDSGSGSESNESALSEGDGSSAAASSTGDGSSSGSLVADRVVVDEGRCNGCGHCLPSCPYGVFGWSASTAVVADANACRLCGRCLQACPAGAITLNA